MMETPEEDDKIEIIHVFVLYVFLDDVKVKRELPRFRNVDDCVYFAKRLSGQGKSITAYCLPEITRKGQRVYQWILLRLWHRPSASFATIKKGYAIGRDVESMMSDIGRWMGALSDLDQAEREAKNPPIFKKLFAGK